MPAATDEQVVLPTHSPHRHRWPGDACSSEPNLMAQTSPTPSAVVIIGAGQAGFQTALSLRENDYRGSVTIAGDEAKLPYQRPPLSKGYLAGEAADAESATLTLRPRSFYQRHGLHLIQDFAVAIDRARSVIGLGSGREI